MKHSVIKSVLFLLVLQVFLSSCIRRILLNSSGVKEEKVTMKYISNQEKDLVFFYIHHIGKHAFFNDVKLKIDSLAELDFFVFYENVKINKTKTKEEMDTIFRKARKLTGIDIMKMKTNKGYIDSATQTFMGSMSGYVKKHKLMNQPANLYHWADTTRAKNIDAYLDELIDACENKYGEIILTEYDYKTNFGEKYTRKNKYKEELKFFLKDYRNELITNNILNSSYKKIVLVYGGAHFNGILENLQKADKNYKQVEK